MNIAFFMKPKADTAYAYDDFTVRQAVEKMSVHGYSAIPVLSREGKYVGTLSEGDLLWSIVRGEGGENKTVPVEDLEKFRLSETGFMRKKNPPITITSSIEELLGRALNQNFIPVVDDREMYIGLVPRSAVIKYFFDNLLSTSDLDDAK